MLSDRVRYCLGKPFQNYCAIQIVADEYDLMVIHFFTLTENGRRLARRIDQLLQEKLSNEFSEIRMSHCSENFTLAVQAAFSRKEVLVMVCATGIVVRTLAPVLVSKYDDPAVLVIDECGKFVIPLLSGHEGGANLFASKVARLIDAHWVQTTSSAFVSKDDINAKTMSPAYPKYRYTLGMGCERNCPQSELLSLLNACLQKARLDVENILSINSIDIKSDEPGLIQLCETLGRPLYTWSADRLREVENDLSQKSDYIYSTVGCVWCCRIGRTSGC